MATVNGNRYTTFGQGYAAEKAKGKGEEADAKPEGGEENESHGGPMMVTHLGGGRFETKTKEKGSKKQHESEEELHAHMSQHFGTGGGEEDEHAEEMMGTEPSEGVGSSVKSILG